jgi:hypothetical protein
VNLIVKSMRLLVAAAIIIAVAATFVDTATRVPINPFNFFGYFTIQSNLIIAAVYLVTVTRSGSDRGGWLALARACATTYLIVVGIVYVVLLAPLGAAGGVPLPWANFILHILVPLYAVADWVLVGDRGRVAFRNLWVAALYPLLWCGVVLVRGATDGWVPYPFLDPAGGYAGVVFYVLIIAAVVVAIGALVFWASRWSGILLPEQRLSR